MKKFQMIQMRMLFIQVIFVLAVKHLCPFLLNVENKDINGCIFRVHNTLTELQSKNNTFSVRCVVPECGWKAVDKLLLLIKCAFKGSEALCHKPTWQRKVRNK